MTSSATGGGAYGAGGFPGRSQGDVDSRQWRPAHGVGRATTTRRRCSPLAALSLAAGLFAATNSAAAQEVFVTSQGDRLNLPSLNGIDCAQIEQVAAIIDSINYRPIGPTPPVDKGDRKLYDYENRLYEIASRKCDRPAGSLKYRHGFFKPSS